MVTSLVIVQIIGTLIWLNNHSMSSKRTMSWQALFDFVRHAPCPSVQPLVHPPSWIHWQPPPTPFFKVNFDGKLFRNSKEAGLGVGIRDYRGRVQAFLPKKAILPPSSIDVEALAAVQAILFAQDLGHYSIILEGDSEVVINSLKSEDESLASFDHLLDFVQPTIDAFSSISFSHTCRLDNYVVHNLAQHARHVSGLLVWIKDVYFHLFVVLLANHD